MLSFGAGIFIESAFVWVESLARIEVKFDVKITINKIVFMAKICIRLMIQICTFLMPQFNTNLFVFLRNYLAISHLKQNQPPLKMAGFIITMKK
ncbi:hypothetical protein GCM10011514_17190 [Emticicia aquatilis]|uniref:Uncharacterized protein n=1 Tax=Emticicia aquatilis TaxID=1537369 RepID=A0A916YNK0_9BACT|nr:hypothetical protein GCM10011514_17190 [Emticicia aquatilis]